MAAEIREHYPDADVRLVESSGGAFEVTVEGDLVYSKLALGRHAEDAEVLGLINARIG